MKFSVLVPAYNVENYIEDSIVSVINQTYINWEMIIVNDGSTDGTMEVLEKYSAEDKRIKIINQENQGLLMARRVAIQEAKGDYICFLDSDDLWENNILEVVNNEINKKNPDLILFNFKKVDFCNNVYDENKHIYENITDELTNEKVLNDFFTTNKLNNIWGKIINKEIIKSDTTDYSKFGKLMQSEDRLQSLPIIFKSNKIIYINERFYNYRNNPESITRNFTWKNFNDVLTTEKHIKDYLLKNNADVKILANSYNHYIYYALGSYLRLVGFEKKTKQEKRAALKIIYQDDNFKNSFEYLKSRNKFFYKLIRNERIFILNILTFINKRRLKKLGHI